jgi:hypothetical protein
MGITKPSGVTAFDIAALESVNRAQPFGPRRARSCHPTATSIFTGNSGVSLLRVLHLFRAPVHPEGQAQERAPRDRTPAHPSGRSERGPRGETSMAPSRSPAGNTRGGEVDARLARGSAIPAHAKHQRD